ncbi:MAG: aminotransferase class V-fold PLP-dependent enzyme, partial [Caulobacterales bacterium]
IVISAIEHDAVFAHAPQLGGALKIAPVTADGVIDLDAFARILADAPKPVLAVLMLANNETGVIQPIANAAALVREAGGLLLVDAAQAIGRMRVSIADLDASYLVISSHKIGGPPGAGALVLAPGAPFAPPRAGGGQERGRRPGTENAPALSGFGVAAETAAANAQHEANRLKVLRDRFEAELPREAIIFGARVARTANTSLFALPGVRAETAVIALDLEGVCVSSGAACSSGKVRQSRVLAAMGVDDALAKGALRVSFGWSSTDADVDAAAAAVRKLAARYAPQLEGAA